MLKPYLKANELCDSIVKCDVIKDMRDSLDNAFDTLSYYYTSKKINDTLKAYFDSSQVKSVISDTADAIRAAIPDAQVQSDWTETDANKKSYIQHKPDLSVYATKASVNTLRDSVKANITAIETKANAADVYTKNEVDSKLADTAKTPTAATSW